MVFSSLIFLYAFLPVSLILYFISDNVKYRNTILCLLSFFFYAWGEPKWVVLLLLGCLADYIIGILIEKYSRHNLIRRTLLAVSVILNIATIGIFKYSAFAVENVNSVLGLKLAVPSFTLPIGISFFTFQKLSYTIDVYRGTVKAQKSFVNFALYISMFFQLIAGPIVRYSWIESEMKKRNISVNEFSKGLKRFCFGVGKKVLLANVAGEFVDKFMKADASTLTQAEAWFGVLMFAMQIYYDFSGYSDMAIGLGRMFGFHFPENFKYPYAALTITDFWRKWHISLSTFFRDYVYIPMGGNKKHMLVNIMTVWALTGLWHGASWNYVLWGVFYGILLIIEKYIVLKPMDKLNAVIAKLAKPLSVPLTVCLYAVRKSVFVFITLMGWTLFYFEDTESLFGYVRTMFGLSGQSGIGMELEIIISNNIYWILAAIALTLPVLRYIKYYAYKLRRKFAAFAYVNETVSSVCSIAILAVSTFVLVGNSYNPFLYFRY